ncbi:MAG: heme A synthase [Bdellovibrionales bacterium]
MPESSYHLPPWFTRAYGILVGSVFGLIALGGSVRMMNAGLACPDWPLCFGDVIPDYHPQVYFEFIHRVVAGLVALATVVLHVVIFRSRAPKTIKVLAGVALGILAAQVVLGGLTVLWQLHSKVVAAHLGMGTGFFATLVWIHARLKQQKVGDFGASYNVRAWTRLFLIAIYAQILLGGLVASHFASLVCVDFPTCHGQWFPTFRGIIGLHVIHRLGAYTIFALAVINLWIMRKYSDNPRLVRLGKGIFAMVCMQVALGIANVLLHTPPLIAVGHLAMATAVLMMALRQVFYAGTARVAASV